MESYREQLLRKAKAVNLDFKTRTRKTDTDSREDVPSLSNEDELLLVSMKRWHENAHMSENDWRVCFGKIQHELDVKEKMNLEEDLAKYLKNKFKQTSLLNRFSVSPLLEFLDNDIRKLYQTKLDERVTELDDEFNLAKVYQGREPEDVTHYEKVFLPGAYFYTYFEKLGLYF